MKNSIVIIFLISTATFGQQSGLLPFRNDITISDQIGNPNDSFAFYFPSVVFRDSTQFAKYYDAEEGFVRGTSVCKDLTTTKNEISKNHHIPFDSITESYSFKIDTFLIQWFSYELYKMKEPVLFNYSLGKEIYRFTWLRSFHRPVVIKIEKDENNIFISSKMLQWQVNLPFFKSYDEHGNEILYDNSIPFEVNKTMIIRKTSFNSFIYLLDQLKITSVPYRPYSPCMIGCDGSEWIFEIQNNSGYYCITRWSPKKGTPLRRIGELLIQMGGFEDEKVY